MEFAGDQLGSRFLQNKIETATSEEKKRVFAEIENESMQLAQDIFGNYVLQKMFEHGSQPQKRILANGMKNKVFQLSTSAYGCRVVQKVCTFPHSYVVYPDSLQALDHVLSDQQYSLIQELEPRVLECVKDQHGNHVIQKAFECAPAHQRKALAQAFRGLVEKQSTHTFGCRIIQRMLEHCDDADRKWVLEELHACTSKLIHDQFGNYVVQHVIRKGAEVDRAAMIEVVKQHPVWYSKHKFASNVVEKSIDNGNESQRRDIIASLTASTAGDTLLFELASDLYGNYVIRESLFNSKVAYLTALQKQLSKPSKERSKLHSRSASSLFYQL